MRYACDLKGLVSPFNVAYTILGIALYSLVPNLADAEAAWSTDACAFSPPPSSGASNGSAGAGAAAAGTGTGATMDCAMKHAPWMGRVLMQYLIIGGIVYSTWHYLCYQRDPPVPKKKMIGRFRSDDANYRDAKLTMSGCVVAALFEMLQIHFWALGYSPIQATLAEAPLRGVVLWFFAAFWADVHFYFAHRILHPWRVSFLGVDPGKLLYKYVHSVHHYANNPGPWSGLAMHPFEHLVYFSRSSWILFTAVHPAIFLFSNIRATVGPAAGHHGYEDFFGSRFHLLHHAYLECNYGTKGFLDKALGTYRDVLGNGGKTQKAK